MYISSITANYDFKPSNWMIFLVMILVFINATNASAQDNTLSHDGKKQVVKNHTMESNIIVEDVYTFVNIQDIKDEYSSRTTITNEVDNIIDDSASEVDTTPLISRKRWIKYDGMIEEEIE